MEEDTVHPLDQLFDAYQKPVASMGAQAAQGVKEGWLSPSMNAQERATQLQQGVEVATFQQPAQTSVRPPNGQGGDPFRFGTEGGPNTPSENGAMPYLGPNSPRVVKPVDMNATGSTKVALDFFQSQGWSPHQAAGIVGNLQAESGSKLNVAAVGDNKAAYGIAQWHQDRQANFEKVIGKPIQGSSLQDQLSFIQWELTHTEKSAGERIRNAKDAATVAALVDQHYERSSGEARQARIKNALTLIKNGDMSEFDGLPLNHKLDLLEAAHD